MPEALTNRIMLLRNGFRYAGRSGSQRSDGQACDVR